MQVRDANVWKDSDPWVRDGGVWKPADTGFVRDAGVWKEFYSAGFNPNTPIGTFTPEEGGYYIGTITYADSREFALFTPEKASGQTDSIRWKTTYTGGGGSLDEDDGWANLQSMIEWGLAQHPMGAWCLGLSIGGFEDFYPPARNELAVMYDARNAITGPDAFDIDNLQYWSSTKASTSTGRVWAVRFDSGQEYGGNPPNGYLRARAIRRLLLG